MRMVEKNTDKQGEISNVLSEENEQKQEGDSDLTAGREIGGGSQQVTNKMADEGNVGEDGFIIIQVKVKMSLRMSRWGVMLTIEHPLILNLSTR